jgi:predicted transposase/invertase (TIGR01784 family)
VYIDLTKLSGVLDKSVDEMTGIEQWAVFLKHAPDETKRDIVNSIVGTREAISMAQNILQTISADTATRMQYESELIWQLDYNYRIDDAWECGVEKGIGLGKIEDAVAMINEGFDADVIQRITKLPDDKLSELFRKYK